jgi:predicted transcriptional regulator
MNNSDQGNDLLTLTTEIVAAHVSNNTVAVGDLPQLINQPISAPAVAKPQHDGYWRAPTNAPACRSDSYHMRRRGAKSFVAHIQT